MPVPKVRGQYTELHQIAQAFGTHAEQLQGAVQRIQQAKNTLQSGDWVGKGATAFYGEMDGQVLPALQRLVSALHQVQEVTEQISAIVKQAEADAAAVFRLNDTNSAEKIAEAEGFQNAVLAPPPWVEVLVKLLEGWGNVVTGAQALINIAVYSLLQAAQSAELLLKVGEIKGGQVLSQAGETLQTVGDMAVVQGLLAIATAQASGQPADGPITPALQQLAQVDASGNPVSPVGADVARLADGRNVQVIFLTDDGVGATPFTSVIIVPRSYTDPNIQGRPAEVGLVAHELTHVLQRDLNDPQYWPNGLRPAAAGYPVGESTNYMEVLSYTVGAVVEYDMRMRVNPNDPELIRLQNEIATYTNNDTLNALRYLIKTRPGNAVYAENYVHELSRPDHRIPPGTWQDHLKRIGFSDDSIRHIEAIATHGVVEVVDPGKIDPLTGIYTP